MNASQDAPMGCNSHPKPNADLRICREIQRIRTCRGRCNGHAAPSCTALHRVPQSQAQSHNGRGLLERWVAVGLQVGLQLLGFATQGASA